MKNELQGAFMGKSWEPVFSGQFRYAEHESVGSKEKFGRFNKQFSYIQ